MCSLGEFEDFIRKKVEKDMWTHKKISDFLSVNYRGKRGFSIRSVQRFCTDRSIHKTSRINDHELCDAVSRATDMV